MHLSLHPGSSSGPDGPVRAHDKSGQDQNRICFQAVLQVRSDLEDLLLQAVDTQGSFVEI